MSKESLQETLERAFRTGYAHVSTIHMGMPTGRIDMFDVLICVTDKLWEPTGEQVSLSYAQIQKRKNEGAVFFPMVDASANAEHIDHYMQ